MKLELNKSQKRSDRSEKKLVSNQGPSFCFFVFLFLFLFVCLSVCLFVCCYLLTRELR